MIKVLLVALLLVLSFGGILVSTIGIFIDGKYVLTLIASSLIFYLSNNFLKQ